MKPNVYLVTGGNKGIGKQIVTELAKEGHRVYLGARNIEAGKATTAELKAYGDVRFVQLDLNDIPTQHSAAKHIEAESGYLDGLINNAGIIVDYHSASNVTLETLR